MVGCSFVFPTSGCLLSSCTYIMNSFSSRPFCSCSHVLTRRWTKFLSNYYIGWFLSLLAGCCTANMMARPGSKASDCQCVYPIEINFRMGNASSAFTNLTSQFQHELASQLALTDVQVQIQAFQFGSNFSLNMVVDIGPLSGISFSLEQIQNINNSLTTHSVHFSSILFADYTVVTIMAFLPASPPTGQ